MDLIATLEDLTAVDRARFEANGQLDPGRKTELGQFMTPTRVASFMAGLFTDVRGGVRLLDAGAGVGSLTAAFIDRWRPATLNVSAYEIDATMVGYLRQTLDRYDCGSHAILEQDFIRAAVYALTLGRSAARFTHAILNPPYKKINSASEHRALLRSAGLETVNLYSAFVGLALASMELHGELVAIIPRSFCNGPYYKPFRSWILERASIDHIHLFHSRTSAFHQDDVLQENIIFKLVRGKRQGNVIITTASDASFADLDKHVYRFEEIVHPDDPDQFMHIPTDPTHSVSVPLASQRLGDIDLEVSTGPVVDFRLKDFLRGEPSADSVPLLYPIHFSGGKLAWPQQGKKPNALLFNDVTKKWLYPAGFYTVVRRFSSKEEMRRIVAHVVDPAAFANATPLAFENHLNVFHSGKSGLSASVAHGLATFLNSTAVDTYFRRFSGHTQVNATDLR